MSALAKRVLEIAGDWRRQPAFVLAAALVIVTGVASLIMFFRMSESSGRVAHTLEVRVTAWQFLSEMENAEAGERSYLLTEQDSFLEPYQRAVEQIAPALDKLRKLTPDNPAQQQTLNRLAPLASARLKFLAGKIALARSGQKEKAVLLIKEGSGKAAMDDIRGLAAEFLQAERVLLEAREGIERRARTILLVLILGGLAGASLLAVMAVNSQRNLVGELQAEARRRESAEASLRQSQKMEAVGQLTGGIAHDFNNLLTIILGNLDTIRRRLSNVSADISAPLARPVDAAAQGAASAARLTHRLLAFSRRQALEPVPLDLNKLIGGLSDFLARTAASPITIETVLAGGLWSTLADPNQVENALLNLALNAKDAMPEGGKITIETANCYLDEAYAARFTEVTPGQYVMLSVTDTGTGIEPAILERVFEPFFTTKEPGTGTGLGLSMIHGFVKQSGGHIRIYSEVGHGTSVKIYLPRLTQQAAMAAAPKANDLDLQPLIRAKPSETVLIVEDNEGVLEFTCSALEDLGYRVLVARDGSEALNIVEGEERIDLLFTDVVLGKDMSGRQLAGLAVTKRRNLPVLFTTGYSPNAIVHQGRLDAGVHLLSKPYTQRELAQKIRAVLDDAAR